MTIALAGRATVPPMLPKSVRKPPVVAIRGTTGPDVITQNELRELAALQDAEWLASRVSQKASMDLEARIAHGATIEPGLLMWDAERNMARSQKSRGKVG